MSKQEYSRLDPKARRLWRLTRTILLLVLVIAATIVYLIWHRELAAWGNNFSGLSIFWIAAGVLISLQLLQTLLYPLVEYRQWSYLLTPDRIEIRKGIIFHQTTIIPITRIQHVTVNEGPLERLYNLASVTVMTAGSSSKIDGLSADVARELCDKLKTAVNVKVIEKTGQDNEVIG